MVLHLMVTGRLQWKAHGAKVPGKIGLAAFDFPTGTLLLTEAGGKKRASLHLVLGEAALANTLGQYELPDQTSINTAVASFVSSTPTNETISMVDGPASGGYPIVNYEYAIVSTRQRNATAARDIKAFLHWIITAGNSPQYLQKVQFQPLPVSVVALCDAQIAKIS